MTRACAMEVSSHALELRRADAIHFAAAMFTNLTQDHLDFHPTMEDYFRAKRRLFVARQAGGGGRQHRRPLRRPAGRTSCSTRSRSRCTPTPTTARSISAATSRVPTFTVRTPDGTLSLRSPLRGEFNVYNVLGALAAARLLGVPAQTCAAAIATAGQVPGRFEIVDAGQPFAVLVDYAHTPDSLENVLSAARGLTAGAADRRVRLRW